MKIDVSREEFLDILAGQAKDIAEFAGRLGVCTFYGELHNKIERLVDLSKQLPRRTE